MFHPLIAVSGIVRLLEGNARTGINAAYVRAVTRVGGIPIILSPLIGPEQAAQALQPLDALILSGGEDLDPSWYGAAPHPALGTIDRDRDAFEFALFTAARARGLPVLAICRGLQLVNVALGGTLYQDLPTERPTDIVHAQPGARHDRTHRITLLPGTRTRVALRVSSFTANSFHHQAIRDLAPGLRVTARADDALVEGVESPAEAPWLVAVQWHPEEFHAETEAPDHGLFAALVEEVSRAPSRL